MRPLTEGAFRLPALAARCRCIGRWAVGGSEPSAPDVLPPTRQGAAIDPVSPSVGPQANLSCVDTRSVTEPAAAPLLRRPLRGVRGALVALVSISTVLAAVVALSVLAPAQRGGLLWTLGTPLRAVTGDATPTPQAAVRTAPIGTPSRIAVTPGPHRFMATQPGSSEPVAYDPCRPVRYVVNARTAPPGGAEALASAIAEIEAATGLRFVAEGVTDERPAEGRQPFQPERYGDRWAPVLIAWSDPAEHPPLRGTVLGRAGSVELTGPDGKVYVTGSVTLDGPEMSRLAARRGERAVEATILHELGHLVGLDHVDDPAQLMAAQTSGVTELQAGDLAGLNRLGAGRCMAEM